MISMPSLYELRHLGLRFPLSGFVRLCCRFWGNFARRPAVAPSPPQGWSPAGTDNVVEGCSRAAAWILGSSPDGGSRGHAERCLVTVQNQEFIVHQDDLEQVGPALWRLVEPLFRERSPFSFSLSLSLSPFLSLSLSRSLSLSV